MKVLLFGFEPFLGFDENPSKRVVEALDGKTVNGSEIVGLILPVEYGRVESLLATKISELGPGLVLGTGLHPGLPKLGITKLAANFKFSSERDTVGESPKGERIAEGEPDGIFMSIDSEGLVARLNEAGIPAVLLLASSDAYLCNLSMFAVARQSKSANPSFGCGFIHLPFTEDFVSKNPMRNAASMSFATMAKGVEAAIGYCTGA